MEQLLRIVSNYDRIRTIEMQKKSMHIGVIGHLGSQSAAGVTTHARSHSSLASLSSRSSVSVSLSLSHTHTCARAGRVSVSPSSHADTLPRSHTHTLLYYILCSMLFGSNVYSVRFCMRTYPRCQGVGWNILHKIHAYFLWVRTKTDSYRGGKKCRKVF